VENISKEHSKTELQRLNLKKSQIKVHEIIDDDEFIDDDSMMMNMEGQAAEAQKLNASPTKRDMQDEASINGRLAERNY
jgi:hypothetical protein